MLTLYRAYLWLCVSIYLGLCEADPDMVEADTVRTLWEGFEQRYQQYREGGSC